MLLSEFRIGLPFYYQDNRFICTDIGMRVVIAVRVEDENITVIEGPPYVIPERIFDEDDIPICTRTKVNSRAPFRNYYL
jgi:hypothetical protein